MRMFIDTNIIVSALLSPNGAASQVLSDVLDGKYKVFVSEEIFQEYADVLHREKFGFDEDIIGYLLDWFRNNAVWVEVTDYVHVVSRLSFILCSALRRWLCCRNPVEGCDYEKNGVTYRTFCYNSNVFWKDYIFASGKDGGYYDERIDFRSKDGF